MDLIDLIPNSMTFRVVTTLNIDDEAEIPEHFTGRVRRSADRVLVYVAWYHHGALHNPSRTTPAYRRYRPGGEVKYDLFYSHGVLDDPTPGVPAVRGYFANGGVHYEEHYVQGVRHDSTDGSPAITKWREDGTVRHQLRYRNGQRVGATA